MLDTTGVSVPKELYEFEVIVNSNIIWSIITLKQMGQIERIILLLKDASKLGCWKHFVNTIRFLSIYVFLSGQH